LAGSSPWFGCLSFSAALAGAVDVPAAPDGSQCRQAGIRPCDRPGVYDQGGKGRSRNGCTRRGRAALGLVLAVGVGVAQAILTIVLLPQIKRGRELEEIAV
jgi:hypothetical protein